MSILLSGEVIYEEEEEKEEHVHESALLLLLFLFLFLFLFLLLLFLFLLLFLLLSSLLNIVLHYFHLIGKKMSILPSGEVIYEEEEEKEEHVHEVVGRTGRVFGGLINDVKRRYCLHTHIYTPSL